MGGWRFTFALVSSYPCLAFYDDRAAQIDELLGVAPAKARPLDQLSLWKNLALAAPTDNQTAATAPPRQRASAEASATALRMTQQGPSTSLRALAQRLSPHGSGAPLRLRRWAPQPLMPPQSTRGVQMRQWQRQWAVKVGSSAGGVVAI